jgi:hypothetical protein
LKQGFYATQLTKTPTGAVAPRLPVLMLNSTAVEDGCRLNVSPLDLVAEGTPTRRVTTCRALEQFSAPDGAGAPVHPLSATRDIDDYVCGDIRLSTAGLLSARFPYVSPTGALTACPDGNAKPGSHTFAVDGGYVDSSGASTVVQLLDSSVAKLQGDLGSSTCVQPVVLQIDNSYEDLTRPVDPSRPSELLAPILGFGAAAGAAADNARQALAVEATRARCNVGERHTYLHLYPRARPGIGAPLGWSLSQAARADMKDQLASAENRAVLCEAHRWLDATPTPCAPGPPPPAPLAATPLLAQASWLWLVLTLIACAVGAFAFVTLRRVSRVTSRNRV